jgi:hypothetical protein
MQENKCKFAFLKSWKKIKCFLQFKSWKNIKKTKLVIKLKGLLIIFGLILFLLWPLIIWHKHVVIDKTMFINEWLKIIGSGIVSGTIFLIICIYGYSLLTIYKNKSDDTILINKILSLFDDIKICLQNKEFNKIEGDNYWGFVNYNLNNFRYDVMIERSNYIRDLENFKILKKFFYEKQYQTDAFINDILTVIDNLKNEINNLKIELK